MLLSLYSLFLPFPVCSKFKADVAFLVDESSSIGPGNFVKLKDFLFRIVSYFPKIGPEGTQVRGKRCTFAWIVHGGFFQDVFFALRSKLS